MPEKIDKCVADVEKKIEEGKIPKEYEDKETGEKKKSNPYAICRAKIKE